MYFSVNNLAMQILKRIVLLFVLFALAYRVEAQKVAIVLSGGGAKGLSHVGVLKALEENEIPIDYIVGNSMGAIIGGLYASGYSPSEIEALVKSVDFKQWVTGKIDERFFNYRLEEANPAWVTIPFSIEKRFISRLPSSLISPYLMDYAVMELFSSASAASDYDFDKLFVPFRCVASDIDSSTLVVLDKGQLGIAIRASATFPLLIKPLVVNDRLLFDGGMFNNFPTEIAHNEFNPDLIIGSVAAGNYDSPRDNDIVSQLQNMLMRKADLTLSEDEGVLIRSKIGPLGLLDFDRIQMCIDSGYQATIDKLPEIKTKIKRRIDTLAIKQSRTSYRDNLPELKFDSVIVRGVKPKQSAYINRKLNYNKKYSNLQTLKSSYFDLLADDKISYIYPQLVFDTLQQQFNLILDVTLSKPFLAEVGGNISSSATNQAFVGLTYRKLSRIGSRYGINAYFGRFYSSVQGEVRFDLPGAQPFFGLMRAQLARKDYFKNATYFFEDPTPAFIIENESGIAIEMGHSLGSKTKAAIGMAGGRRSFDYYQTNNFSRNDTADISQLDFIKPYVGIYYNSLNKKYLANAGMRWYVELAFFDGKQKNIPGSNLSKSLIFSQNQAFYRLKVHYDNFFAKTGRFTYGFLGEALLSDQKLQNNYTASVLSAPVFEPIGDMKTIFLERYRAYNYLGAGFKLIYSPFRNMDIRAETYMFQPYERIVNKGINEVPYFSVSFPEMSWVFSGRVVLHTPLGPLSAALNYYDRENNKFMFVINFGYLLFNRSNFD